MGTVHGTRNATRRSPGAEPAVSAIGTLGTLLKQLAGAAVLLGPPADHQAPRQRRGAFAVRRADFMAAAGQTVESIPGLLAAAKAEAEKLRSMSPHAPALVESAGRHLQRLCRPAYHPMGVGVYRSPPDHFIDPERRITNDMHNAAVAGRAAEALVAMLKGKEVADPAKHFPPPTYLDALYDPIAPYEGLDDPLIVLGLLRDFRTRISWLKNANDWRRWVEGTERHRWSATARVRGLETDWLNDVTRTGFDLEWASRVFRDVLSLADELATLPDEFPGSGVLKQSSVGLHARFEILHDEFCQIVRIASGRTEEQVLAEPVILMGRGECPIVLGKPVQRLTGNNFKVIEALVKAGPAGLHKGELDEIADNWAAPQKLVQRLW
jgi:hypothetical protein